MNSINTAITSVKEVSVAVGTWSTGQTERPESTSDAAVSIMDTEQKLIQSEVGRSVAKAEPQSVPEEQLAEFHSFSRKLAKDYGATAAVILGYLANRVQAVEKRRKDGLGYFISIRKLGMRYPYLRVSTIADTLTMLRKEGVLKAENHNKYKYDRKFWYTFANPQVQKDAALDTIRFNVADAVNYGILEAVLLANLRYWITENRKKTPDYSWHRMSADILSKHLPFSSSSLRRGLEDLVAKGVAQRQRCQGFDNAFSYRLLDAVNFHQSNLEMHQSKVAMHQSNPEMHQSNPEMHQSNPHNDIILVDSVEKTSLKRLHCEEHVGENTFIIPAATPSGSCGCLDAHTPADQIEDKEVTNAQHLPMPAEGTHSQVRVPGGEALQEKSFQPSAEKESSTKPVLMARDFLKRPAGLVSSAKISRLSLESSTSSGLGQIKIGNSLSPGLSDSGGIFL